MDEPCACDHRAVVVVHPVTLPEVPAEHRVRAMMGLASAFDATLLSRIEDAALNASAPPQQRWVDGWLLRYSPGRAKRARCVNAVALCHPEAAAGGTGAPARLPLPELRRGRSRARDAPPAEPARAAAPAARGG